MYKPREDSYLLEKWVRRFAKGRVLDMGTGSGILALAALEKGCDVLAVDINPKSVAHVKSLGVDAVVSDLFSNVEGKFDVIVFNPPYLPAIGCEDADVKLVVCGGDVGNEIINRFLLSAKKYLAKGGRILLLFSSDSGAVCLDDYESELLEELDLDREKLYVYSLC